MKKKILLVTALVICLAIAAAGTLAYFTSEDEAHNVITSGDVTIELVEQTEQEDGTLADFPEEGIRGVMPALPPVRLCVSRTLVTVMPGCA